MGDIDTLLKRLTLEPAGGDVFIGHTPNDGRPRVYGGLAVAQSLVAAANTVDRARVAHSIHGFFLRPGDPKQPIRYEVDRIRDGGSFTTRRVVARQGAEAIFNAGVSFQVPEDGLSHERPMPDAPAPESLPSETDVFAEYLEQTENPVFDFLLRVENPVDFRDVDPIDLVDPKPFTGAHRAWCRAFGPMPDDPVLHQAVLAYCSDRGLLGACIRQHGFSWLSRELIIASLDHAIWFHRPARLDEWLLYDTESPSSQGGRGLNFGRFYDREGRLVASSAQESLMRRRRPRA